MVNTLTNKTIMADISGAFAEDLRRTEEAYSEARRVKNEQKGNIMTRLSTLEYDTTRLRVRVNDLEKKNEVLSLVNNTIMKELEIKNPVFQKELRQKVSKVIRNLKR